MSSVKLTDNSDEVMELFNKAVERGLEVIGGQAERHAKTAETLVDTGRLRNSITWAVDGKQAQTKTYRDNNGNSYSYSGTTPKETDGEKAVYVGSNVEYAPYVEFGSPTVPAQHFLQDACQNHSEEYKNIMKGSLQAVEY